MDLSHIHLGTKNVFVATTKPKAEAFAKAHGWRKADVIRAYNRFMMFWVVGQNYTEGSFRLLSKDGNPVDIVYRETAGEEET